MMKTNPLIDEDFVYVSPFLKRVLKQYESEFKGLACLDIPAGNGRNTFLLASVFNLATAVDIRQDYLDAIIRNTGDYPAAGTIQTICADILSELPPIDQYDLICNIHLYNEALVRHTLKFMRRGAMLLVETPGCYGENYKLLPNRPEIDGLLANCTILMQEFKICGHKDNIDKRGPLKLLIRK